MPYRTVKPVSDRGSIRDLNKKTEENPSENPPIPLEIRLAALYERAEQDKNVALMNSLPFITMQNPGERALFPVTVVRLREKVNAIKEKCGDLIKMLSEELAPAWPEEAHSAITEVRMAARKRAMSLQTVIDDPMVKTAGPLFHPKRSFRRLQS